MPGRVGPQRRAHQALVLIALHCHRPVHLRADRHGLDQSRGTVHAPGRGAFLNNHPPRGVFTSSARSSHGNRTQSSRATTSLTRCVKTTVVTVGRRSGLAGTSCTIVLRPEGRPLSGRPPCPRPPDAGHSLTAARPRLARSRAPGLGRNAAHVVPPFCSATSCTISDRGRRSGAKLLGIDQAAAMQISEGLSRSLDEVPDSRQ